MDKLPTPKIENSPPDTQSPASDVDISTAAISDSEVLMHQKIALGVVAAVIAFGALSSLVSVPDVMREIRRGITDWDQLISIAEAGKAQSEERVPKNIADSSVESEEGSSGKEAVKPEVAKTRIELADGFADAMPDAGDFEERGRMTYTAEEIQALEDGLVALSETMGVAPEAQDFRALGDGYVLEWLPNGKVLILDPEIGILTELEFPSRNNGGVVLNESAHVVTIFEDEAQRSSFFEALEKGGIVRYTYIGNGGDDGTAYVPSASGAGDSNFLSTIVLGRN